MTNVHTLRIIFGHATLADTLIRCFFDKHRQTNVRIRKLWLENCRITTGFYQHLTAHPYGLPLELDFSGLESVRFRRLPVPSSHVSRSCRANNVRDSVYWRGDNCPQIQNGMGGFYGTSIQFLHIQVSSWLRARGWAFGGPERGDHLMKPSWIFDTKLWDMLNEQMPIPDDIWCAGAEENLDFYDQSLLAYPEDWCQEGVQPDYFVPPSELQKVMAHTPPLTSAKVMMSMLHSASTTLTSLTLDWILAVPNGRDEETPSGCPDYDRFVELFIDLFSLRFAHLRAFQYRNAVVDETALPTGLYLLDRATVVNRYGKLQ